ncbi:MAG: zinc-ribbon domain-containing protein [Bacilli bacterium]|nr:zinc-ribbon domain-containing protein [Bacilli bacterium]
MKFCTNCGNKLSPSNKFCTNCGKEIKKDTPKKVVKEVKEPKEFNVNNLILYVGVSLVILATLIFAICTWENMSGLFKISFLTFETLLFFIISFTFAKIKNNGLSKAFYLLAVMMIPIILYTIPVYSLLGDYLSYKGAGIFVYLAISNLLCAGIYFMSYMLLRTKAFTFISYTFVYGTLVSIFLAFEKSISFLLISSLVFVLLVIILNFILRKDSFFKRSLTMFTSILFSLLSIFMVGALYVEFNNSIIKSFDTINLNLILITVLFIANTFVFIYQNRKSIYTYVSPFVVLPNMLVILGCMIEDARLGICLFAGISLVIYIAFLLFKNKYLNITSKIITYVALYLFTLGILFTMDYDSDMYLALAIVGAITLGFNIINRYLEKFKWVSDSLIPLACIFIVYGLIRTFIDFPNVFIVLLLASIYLVTYMFLKAFNKPINKIYYLYALASMIVAMFMCTYSTGAIYIIFLNVLLLILFIFVSFMEKISAVNIITFIVLAISLLKIRLLFDIDERIIFASISLISIVVGIILRNTNKVLSKFYLYSGQILSLILSLTISSYTQYIVTALIGVLFVINFISICLFNNSKPFRIIAEMVGLILIFLIINSVIEITLFSTIITLFVYMTVLVIFGLTGKEKAGTNIILSTVCLIPYYDYVFNSGNTFGITNQLVILPFIVYLFVLAFYFKMNDKTRFHVILWPLLVLSTIAINTTTVGVIFALTLALGYIFIGIIKKYRYLVTYGIIYMFVTLVIELMKLFNNLALLIAVLAIGLILILYVVINEVYKSKKNK